MCVLHDYSTVFVHGSGSACGGQSVACAALCDSRMAGIRQHL